MFHSDLGLFDDFSEICKIEIEPIFLSNIKYVLQLQESIQLNCISEIILCKSGWKVFVCNALLRGQQVLKVIFIYVSSFHVKLQLCYVYYGSNKRKRNVKRNVLYHEFNNYFLKKITKNYFCKLVNSLTKHKSKNIFFLTVF